MVDMLSPSDRELLQVAIGQARIGQSEGGIPIGAVLATAGRPIGLGRNRRVQLGSVIRHAEMDALEEAGRLTAGVYRTATMYSTLAPCSMCTGAVLLYGIPRVVVGENRTFEGSLGLLRSSGVEVILADDPDCIAIMEAFIGGNPTLWDEDIGE